MTPAQIERHIVRLGRKGCTDQALATFESLKRPTIRQVNAAIDACARARPVRLDQAFAILKQSTSKNKIATSSSSSSSIQPNVYTFGALMSACARAHRVDLAVNLLRTMQDDYGVKPNAVVYHSAISACDRSHPPEPETALRLLDEASAKGVCLGVVGYNAAVSAMARAGDWQGAHALVQRMKNDSNDSDDDDDCNANCVPQPDAVTYGTLLAAYERARQWDALLESATKMQAAGYDLDGLALTSVLHACQQLGRANDAINFLKLMKQQAAAETPPRYRRHTAGRLRVGARPQLQGPDAVAYLLAISACARGGEWLQGMRLLDDYCNETPADKRDVAVYTAAIGGCEAVGEWKAALAVVERMRRHGVEPNEVTFTSVLGACATACANEPVRSNRNSKSSSGMPVAQNKALKLLNVLRKDPNIVKPNIAVYNAAIRTCAEACDLARAFQLLEKLKQDGLEPTIVTYGTLTTACERLGSVDGLSKVLGMMREDGLEANEVIYGAAVSCCRKAGQSERALLLLRKMIRKGMDPSIATFHTVLMAQAEGRYKDLDRAMLVYNILKAGQYASATPNRQTYSIVVRALAEGKLPREAESVLREMQRNGLVPDVELYTAVVASYERKGQPLGALRLMESMNAVGYDFYEVKVLNAAFKRALKVVNLVGQKFPAKSIEEEQQKEREVSYYLKDGHCEEFLYGVNEGGFQGALEIGDQID